MKRLALALAAMVFAGSASAGNIFLTGHDILLHGGGDGYDGVILDYLRGVGTATVADKGDYDIAIVGSRSSGGSASFMDSGGSGNFTGLPDGGAISLTGTLTGYGSAKFYDAQTANWAEVLTADALVILSHTTCGGCSLTSAGSAAVNAQAAAIAAAFNDGMDIWGLSGATLATYYDFLPPGAVATGVSIFGDDFTATAAGVGIGITPEMTDGDPTHNRFTAIAPAFTVFETRDPGDLTEIVSIGIQDARIIEDDIITDGTTVPEPGMLTLLGLGLLGIGLSRRRRRG